MITAGKDELSRAAGSALTPTPRTGSSLRSGSSTFTTQLPASCAQAAPKMWPCGRSTPRTTRRSSSSATSTSRVPRASRTRSTGTPGSVRFCGRTSMRSPGRRCTRRAPSIPKTRVGKSAVKVINHYGDEVLRVYEWRGQHDTDSSVPLPGSERPDTLDRTTTPAAAWRPNSWSRMRGDSHVRFGMRPAETDRPKGRNRAGRPPVRHRQQPGPPRNVYPTSPPLPRPTSTPPSTPCTPASPTTQPVPPPTQETNLVAT